MLSSSLSSHGTEREVAYCGPKPRAIQTTSSVSPVPAVLEDEPTLGLSVRSDEVRHRPLTVEAGERASLVQDPLEGRDEEVVSHPTKGRSRSSLTKRARAIEATTDGKLTQVSNPSFRTSFLPVWVRPLGTRPSISLVLRPVKI